LSNTAELQEALEDYRAAETYLNEASAELVDRAICRYNAADERLKWLLREAKLESGIKVDWKKIEEKRLEVLCK
jgi:hypothetical protein